MIPLGWIPVIGPIIDGIFGYLNKKQDTAVEIRKVEGEERTVAMTTSASILTAFKDDISIKVARDIVVYPTVIHAALTMWDYTVVTKFPDLVWGTKAIPVGSGYEWLAYAVMVFLLGNTYLNKLHK